MSRKFLVSDREVRAFDIVELILYIAAITKFGVDMLWPIEVPRQGPEGAFAALHDGWWWVVLAIVVVFTLVILRNYIVMKSIDTDEHSEREDYTFIRANSPGWATTERIFRLLIICAVIFSPKSFGRFSLNPFPWVVGQLQAALTSLSDLVAELLNVPLRYHCTHGQLADPDCALHDTLSYYGAVVVGFAALFVAWDLVNVIAIRSRLRKSDLGVDYDNNLVGNVDYRSLLMYLNIFSYTKSGEQLDQRAAPQYIFCPAILHGRFVSGRRLVESSSVVWLYLVKSPKFRERLALAVIGASFVWCSATDSHDSAPALLLLGFAFYLRFAWYNQEYIEDFVKLLSPFSAYFRGTGVRPHRQRPSARRRRG